MGISPTVIDETRGFWEGTLVEELRVQGFGSCGNLQFPGSALLHGRVSHRGASVGGRLRPAQGEVFSFTIVRHAFHPSFSDQIPICVGRRSP